MSDHKFHGCDPAVLKQMIAESGLRYSQNSKSYIFTCPRCKGAKKLFLRKSDGRFVCWKCKEVDGYQGRPEYALADLIGHSVREVVARLYQGRYQPTSVFLDVKIADFYGDGDEDDDFEIEVLPTIQWESNQYPIDHRHAARGVEYLESRGIPVDVAAQYGIRYWPERLRLMIPVEAGGRLHGWQGRLVVDHRWIGDDGEQHEGLKIESSKNIPRERVLMFADRLVGSEHAVLGEGPFDALKAHLCGGNVSPMGKAVGDLQMGVMLNAGITKVYSGLDPDADPEFMRLFRTYYDHVEFYRMVARVHGADEKPDLGAMDFKDVYELFRGARRVTAGQIFVFLNPRVAG